MKNRKIRERLAAAGIYQWQLAEAMGVSEYTLCVWLRRELDGERLQRVEDALERLTGGVSE